MSDEVLTQEEVESLLSAMDPNASKAGAAAVGRAVPAVGGSRMREKITPYDFRRPERVGKEQMRALQSLHEGFGRNFVDYYLRIKEAEIARFQSEVTDWEQKEYFDLY